MPDIFYTHFLSIHNWLWKHDRVIFIKQVEYFIKFITDWNETHSLDPSIQRSTWDYCLSFSYWTEYQIFHSVQLWNSFSSLLFLLKRQLKLLFLIYWWVIIWPLFKVVPSGTIKDLVGRNILVQRQIFNKWRMLGFQLLQKHVCSNIKYCIFCFFYSLCVCYIGTMYKYRLKTNQKFSNFADSDISY